MKKTTLFSAAAAFLLFAGNLKAQAPGAQVTGPNQTALIEKVTANPGELKIAYEKYKLPNGLTLIIHEDHSDPIVHVEVTYHVGSNRESIGKSGFAHFFEHMMFQGSMHVKDEEHFKIVQGAGGQMNGTTNRDRTNYFETLPANYLETALWLEADRMGFLLDSVTQKKFEVQRATVKNEKGERVDNVPYGKVDEIKDATLYPNGHPYSWPTIGYLEDLDRVDVNDLKNFFMRWYGPNNACLVVAGDVNPQEVIKLTEKYFGPIPRGPEVRPLPKSSFRLPENKYANYGDNVFLPLYYIVYPTVANYHADEPAVDLLANILGNGNNSIFYKNFIKSEKAVQAAVFHPASELAGEFTIAVLPLPNIDGDIDVEKMVASTLAEFEKNGVSDDDLARAKGAIESNLIFSMQSVAARASTLSMMWYLSNGTPRLAKGFNMGDELARYQKVTKEDIMRVYRTYIKDKKYVMVNVFPKRANAAVGAKEETKTGSSGTPAKTELEYKGLSYTAPKDNFDRSKRPTANALKPYDVPSFYATNWDNGMKVIGTETKESPVVTLLLTMKGGNIAVGDPSKTGLAAMTADMMEEATQSMTSEQFESELAKLGSTISFNATSETNTVQVISLKKNLDATLKLFEEKLLRPKFNSDEFKLAQSLRYQSINSEKYDAASTADLAYNKLIYGKTIAAEPIQGTLKSVKSISMKDVQNYYDRFYGPDFSSLTIVGDISESEILPKLEFLKNWKKKNITFPPLPVPPAAAGSNKQIYLVDKYKAAQSEIRIGMIGQKYDWNDRYFKTNAMNFPLGGNFNSRLNLNLREDKGFTYGIRSSNYGYKDRQGAYTIATGVRTSATDSAMKEIMSEVTNYADNGMTEEELKFMKTSLTQGDALRYETTFQKAGFLNRLVEYNLPKDFIKQQNDILNNLSKEELNRLAKEILDTNKMTILVVGDKEKIKARLEALGYKIVDYKEVEVATYEKN